MENQMTLTPLGLSQSMDSVNTASNEEEVSDSFHFSNRNVYTKCIPNKSKRTWKTNPKKSWPQSSEMRQKWQLWEYGILHTEILHELAESRSNFFGTAETLSGVLEFGLKFAFMYIGKVHANYTGDYLGGAWVLKKCKCENLNVRTLKYKISKKLN